jgi:chemotaxis protein methyltransferase CheR
MALQVRADRDREVEDLEIDLLLTAIVRRYGYDFRNYAPASLRRRVRNMQKLEGVRTISALQERLLRDTACMERFIANLSVSVTAMFRDPEFYRVLRSDVVPMLRTYPFVRVWHVGCATGEEVYSMAILLEEEGLYDRCRLYATDISDRALRRAAKGVFPLDRMKENTSNYLRSGGRQDFSGYYTADARSAIFRDSLRRNMIYSQHNLVSDGPFNEFNLVLCRNVLIYFDTTLRERVHELLHASLAPFGVLGLGVKETVNYTGVASRYRPLGGLSYLFRKES